jgi:hypothetical protein
VIQRSSMQKIVALLVTEAELFAATSNAQDMMYVKRLLKSIILRVHLPMILEVDNKGAVDLVSNFSVGGRTRHIETIQYYLRELKEQGVISVFGKQDLKTVVTCIRRIWEEENLKNMLQSMWEMMNTCRHELNIWGECQRSLFQGL